MTNAGLFTTSATAPIVSGGAFTQDGAGANSLGADVTISGADLSFLRAITLTENVQLSSGAGAGNIALSSTVNAETAASGESLTLVAGLGNIVVTGPVGTGVANRIGALTVTSAVDATFSGAVYAAGFAQAAGTGTTTLNGAVNTSAAAGVTLTGTNLVLNAGITTAASGVVTLNHSGTTTIAAAGDINADGAVSLAATGGITTAGDVTTTADAIGFNSPTTLSGSIALASAGGNVTFASTLSGTTDGAENLRIAAGAGNVSFGGAVGATRLGVVDVDSAANVTSIGLTAAALNQDSGSGTTTLNGAVNTSAAAGVTLTGTNLVLNAPVTTAASGVVTLNHSGTTTIAAAGDINADGAVSIAATGGISTAGDVTTTADAIGFNSATTFTDAAALSSTGGAIDFAGAVSVNANLSVDAGTALAAFASILTIADAVALDFGATRFSVATLDMAGAASRVRLSGEANQAGSTIATFDAARGVFEYYGPGGTVWTSGWNPSGTHYFDLELNGDPGSSFAFEGAATLAGSLTLDEGTLELGGGTDIGGDIRIRDGSSLDVTASNHALVVRGANWVNAVGPAGFVARNGTVRFDPASMTVDIYGNNDWWIFWVEGSGLTVRFQNGTMTAPSGELIAGDVITQRVISGGLFRILGTVGNPDDVVLTRIDATKGEPTLPSPIVPGDDRKFWFFDLVPGASLDMAFATVRYSNARSNPVSVPPDVVASYAGTFSFKWLSQWFSLYGYTEDFDYDGKLDRLRVTAEGAVGNDFTGFAVEVRNESSGEAYTVAGFERPVPGANFYILLEEKPYLDSGATIVWRVVSNTTLYDGTAGDKKVGNLASSNLALAAPAGSDPDLGDWMRAGDTAWPVIGYALGLPALDGTFVHFSEDLGGLSQADFTGATSFAMISGGPGTREALVGLGARSVAQLLASPTFTVTPTIADLGTPPYYEASYAGQVAGMPYPTYPFVGGVPGYVADPNGYDAGTDYFGADRPAFELGRGGENVHRLTDVLVSIRPATAADATYFAWPTWAKDSAYFPGADSSEPELLDLAVPDSAASDASTASTVGLVRRFDGSQWLRDEDFDVRVRVNPALSPADLSLVYDTDVPPALRSGLSAAGLWLPAFAETAFSGLVPYPNVPGTAGDLNALSGVADATPGFWNFAVDSSDPELRDRATFDFFLHLDAPGSIPATDPLYVARLDIAPGAPVPTDWYRLVRPFSLRIRDIEPQKGGVTIMNNVIDPGKGETARLNYRLAEAGRVTVLVLTLDGDVVRALYRGTRAAGDYTDVWDGRNAAGNPVARGAYFIRVVGPGVDEIRKVLVVKNP